MLIFSWWFCNCSGCCRSRIVPIYCSILFQPIHRPTCTGYDPSSLQTR